MSSVTYTCAEKCCAISIALPKPHQFSPRAKRRGRCQKAGVFIYDPEQERVLLVQSRGQLWGMPKGTLEIDIDENSAQCAIREVKEETGLDLTVEDFTRATKIKNRATYYYAEKKAGPICIQENPTEPANDANGITWIKISCLQECINTGQIVLNQHCRIVFKRFLNMIFPELEFIRVVRKRKKAVNK